MNIYKNLKRHLSRFSFVLLISLVSQASWTDSGPTINCPPFNLTLECSDPANSDYIDTHLDLITASSNCPGPITLSHNYTGLNGSSCNNISTEVIFTAVDACGESTTCSTYIILQDNTPPSINSMPPSLCDETECGGDVQYWFSHWIDYMMEGMTATDDCDANLTLSTLPVNPILNTTCGDSGNALTDVLFVATDDCGNSASVSGTFTITNSSPGQFVHVPEDKIVNCGQAAIFSEPGFEGGCDAIITTSDLIDDADPCEIVMTRIWTATESCGNLSISIAQTISIIDDEAPVFTTIPTNGNVACLNDVAFDFIMAVDNCGDVSITSSDVTSGDACFGTLTRTWTATDLCGNNSTASASMTYSDSEAPTADNVPADLVVSVGESFAFSADPIWSDNCDHNLDLSFLDTQGIGGCPSESIYTRTWIAQDDCGNSSSVSQTITVEDNEAPLFVFVPEAYHFECTLPYDFPAAVAEDNGGPVTVTYTNSTEDFGCSWHITRTWTATDLCGNTSTASETFTSSDTSPPVFITVPAVVDLDCDDDLIFVEPTIEDACTGVNLTWEDEINGTLCDAGYAWKRVWTATDNCGNSSSAESVIWVDPDYDAPEFTFVPAGGVISCGDFPPTFGEPEIVEACGGFVLTQVDEFVGNENGCAEGESFSYRRVWTATDECGNVGTAYQTFLINTDNAPQGDVLGLIATEMGEAVEDVTVLLEGAAVGYQEIYVTDNTGEYLFENLPLDYNYSVTPGLDNEHMNGVSTYDLILINQHILDIQNLDSPYKIIAADINRSGSITVFDLVELRKMILNINTEFPDNNSWRFVASDFVFPQATNPFATVFPESASINGLTAGEQHDFVGVKIGDVNGSAISNTLLSSDERDIAGEIVFDVNDQRMEAGKLYEVTFRANNFTEIVGFQYALDFDIEMLEWVGVKENRLPEFTESNIGLSRVEDGIFSSSWNQTEGLSYVDGTRLFTISFRAKENVLLSQAIRISSDQLEAQAYAKNSVRTYDVKNLSLRFIDRGEMEDHFAVYQNIPNPFTDYTSVGFYLPKADRAVLKVYDVSGRLVLECIGDMDQGYNEFKVEAAMLQGEGVLYYEISTPQFRRTKRMLFNSNE